MIRCVMASNTIYTISYSLTKCSVFNVENNIYSFITYVTPQKYTMAGTSQFVPSLNAITTNQDLQWLVQPSLMHPPGPSRSPAPPYPVATRPLGPTLSHSHLLRPGVIRASASPAAASTRRRNDEHVRTIFLKSSN